MFQTFANVIEVLAWSAAGIGVLRTYLSINKVWPRKHIAEVAESISIWSASLGILTAIPFLIQATVLKPNFSIAVGILLGIASGTFSSLVAVGYWVADARRPSLASRILRPSAVSGKKLAT